MKPINTLIDFIMIHEGKKTLHYIEKHSLEEKANEKTLLKLLKDNKDALWREFKITMGSSANQVKPVRILDAPIKRKFFFGLFEPGQDVSDLYSLKIKK